jgi:hypothetical protein
VDKQWFNDEMNKIIVPQEELSTAIKASIAKAQQEKPAAKNVVLRRKAPLIAAALFIGFIGSGFVFPQMNRVLADMPVIGKIYSIFQDPLGQKLLENNLVTEVNQKVVSNGVGVTVLSAYYDEGRVGITFDVDSPNLVKGNRISNDFDFKYVIADGNPKWERDPYSSGLITSEGCFGQIQFYYPEKELPQNTTLPITITSIGSTNGTWKFDIPINQLENKKIKVQQSVANDDKKHQLYLGTITAGKVSTAFDYKAFHSLDGENDLTRIYKVTDDQGKEVPFRTSGIEFGRKNTGNTIESEERSIFGKIPDQTKFLMIYPYVREYEKDVFHSLDDKTPFEIHGNRSDAKITVNRIEHKGQQLIMQYTLDNVDTKKITMSQLEYFGENLILIDSSQIGKDIAPIGQIIKGSKVKVLDSANLQFQATFKLDGEYGAPNFSLGGYSLEIPLSLFLPEIALPPIKVNLD